MSQPTENGDPEATSGASRRRRNKKGIFSRRKHHSREKSGLGSFFSPVLNLFNSGAGGGFAEDIADLDIPSELLGQTDTSQDATSSLESEPNSSASSAEPSSPPPTSDDTPESAEVLAEPPESLVQCGVPKSRRGTGGRRGRRGGLLGRLGMVSASGGGQQLSNSLRRGLSRSRRGRRGARRGRGRGRGGRVRSFRGRAHRGRGRGRGRPWPPSLEARAQKAAPPLPPRKKRPKPEPTPSPPDRSSSPRSSRPSAVLTEEDIVRRQRHLIYTELVETEEAYVDHLRTFQEFYVAPAVDQGILTQRRARELFGQSNVVRGINESFLSDLKGCVDETDYVSVTKLTAVLSRFTPLFSLYSDYIKTYPTVARNVSEEKENNERFRTFLGEVSVALGEAGKRIRNLTSYLLCPIQRLPRYRLLLQNLVDQLDEDAPEAMQLKSALGLLETIITYCNERVRDWKNSERLVKIAKKLAFPLLIQPGRQLIKEAENLRCQRMDSKANLWCNVYLLTDLLVVHVLTDEEHNDLLLQAEAAGADVSEDDFVQVKKKFNWGRKKKNPPKLGVYIVDETLHVGRISLFKKRMVMMGPLPGLASAARADVELIPETETEESRESTSTESGEAEGRETDDDDALDDREEGGEEEENDESGSEEGQGQGTNETEGEEESVPAEDIAGEEEISGEETTASEDSEEAIGSIASQPLASTACRLNMFEIKQSQSRLEIRTTDFVEWIDAIQAQIEENIKRKEELSEVEHEDGESGSQQRVDFRFTRTQENIGALFQDTLHQTD